MVLQINRCLNINNQAVHSIHRLAWSPMLVIPRATAPSAHALRWHYIEPYGISHFKY